MNIFKKLNLTILCVLLVGSQAHSMEPEVAPDEITQAKPKSITDRAKEFLHRNLFESGNISSRGFVNEHLKNFLSTDAIKAREANAIQARETPTAESINLNTQRQAEADRQKAQVEADKQAKQAEAAALKATKDESDRQATQNASDAARSTTALTEKGEFQNILNAHNETITRNNVESLKSKALNNKDWINYISHMVKKNPDNFRDLSHTQKETILKWALGDSFSSLSAGMKYQLTNSIPWMDMVKESQKSITNKNAEADRQKAQAEADKQAMQNESDGARDATSLNQEIEFAAIQNARIEALKRLDKKPELDQKANVDTKAEPNSRVASKTPPKPTRGVLPTIPDKQLSATNTGKDNLITASDETRSTTTLIEEGEFKNIQKNHTDALADMKAKAQAEDDRKNTFINHIHKNENADAILLLNNHPDLANAKNKNGGTVLHLAIHKNNEEMVKALLAKGANINFIYNDSDRPMDTADFAKTKSASMNELLATDKNINPIIKGKLDKRLRTIDEQNDDLVKYIQKDHPDFLTYDELKKNNTIYDYKLQKSEDRRNEENKKLLERRNAIKEYSDPNNKDDGTKIRNLLSNVGTLVDPSFKPSEAQDYWNIQDHINNNILNYQARLNELHEEQYHTTEKLSLPQKVQLLEQIIPSMKNIKDTGRFSKEQLATLLTGKINY